MVAVLLLLGGSPKHRLNLKCPALPHPPPPTPCSIWVAISPPGDSDAHECFKLWARGVDNSSQKKKCGYSHLEFFK